MHKKLNNLKSIKVINKKSNSTHVLEKLHILILEWFLQPAQSREEKKATEKRTEEYGIIRKIWISRV